MPDATEYEVVIRGRASARLLRPLVDDFTVDHSQPGVTRLLGSIRDASQLHGVLVHLTSVGAEVISIAPVDRAPSPPVPVPAPVPDPTDRGGPSAAPTPRKP